MLRAGPDDETGFLLTYGTRRALFTTGGAGGRSLCAPAPPACVLGPVHGVVGGVDELFGAVAIGRKARHADAAADFENMPGHLEGLGEAVHDLGCGGFDGGGAGRAGHGHDELVAAKAGHGVFVAKQFEQARGNLLQQQIADVPRLGRPVRRSKLAWCQIAPSWRRRSVTSEISTTRWAT